MQPRELVEKLIYGREQIRRYTQDTPILLDVWITYIENPGKPADLLLTPYQQMASGDATAGSLCKELRDRLNRERASYQRSSGDSTRKPSNVAYNQATVAVRLYFDELVRVVLPMSAWWHQRIFKKESVVMEARSDNQDADAKPETPQLNASSDRHIWLLDMLQVETEKQFLTRALEDPTILPGPDSVSEPRKIVVDADSHRVAAPQQRIRDSRKKVTPDILWMLRCIGTVALAEEKMDDVALSFQEGPDNKQQRLDAFRLIVDRAATLLKGLKVPSEDGTMIFSVSCNRKVSTSVWRSRTAVKADASARVFDVSCKDLAWAIVDSGIDARHWAFRKVDPVGKSSDKTASSAPSEQEETWNYRLYKDPFVSNPRTGKFTNNTRVLATYDFTKIRQFLDPESNKDAAKPSAELARQLRDLRKSLLSGRDIEWALLLPFIQVSHDDTYHAPVHEHGTHVAGILGADWHATDPDITITEDLRGICPEINFYDLRVLDENGEGDEFNVMAALQFVRSLNAHKDYMVVHGANLSLSTPHDVSNYACGRTPICEECERLVGAGIVVVAAAGNDGYLQYVTTTGEKDGYHNISITDPGNAEGVITVGSTHRDLPHTYGVSYFSSRGPTGDGRMKPDLVAPGEKIEGPTPGNAIKRKDGTSMAAPHVSGAAALLMARHRELIGQPLKIKQILCASATDLNRERYFQGAGMLDILRALQSV